MTFQKPEPDCAFLKLPFTEKVLRQELPASTLRADLATAGRVKVGLPYIFKHRFRSGFAPTLLGDALLVTAHDWDMSLPNGDIEQLAQMFWQKGFSLGAFSQDRLAVMRLTGEFRRANFYCPREELLARTGDIVEDVDVQSQFLLDSGRLILK